MATPKGATPTKYQGGGRPRNRPAGEQHGAPERPLAAADEIRRRKQARITGCHQRASSVAESHDSRVAAASRHTTQAGAYGTRQHSRDWVGIRGDSVLAPGRPRTLRTRTERSESTRDLRIVALSSR